MVKADAILAADLHLREDVPRCRTDDFHEARRRKLQFIRDLQHQHECPLLVAGDVFHHWKAPPWLLREALELMGNVIAIPGQHDLPQHRLNAYPLSALAVLEQGGAARCLNPVDGYGLWVILRKGREERGPIVTGFPWGAEPTPICRTAQKGQRVAALVHYLVYPGKPPFPGAEVSGSTAKALLRKMAGFDLIVTGDNHETFVVCSNGVHTSYPNPLAEGGIAQAPRLLVNPGSMMRSTAAQADHEPSVFLWYAEENRVERVVLPHDKGVVSRGHIEEEKHRDALIEAFVDRVQGKVDLDLDFVTNLIRHMDRNNVPPQVREIVMKGAGR